MLGRCGERVAEPAELVVGDLAVVPPRHAGVEADDPQSGDVVDPVLGFVGLLAEQLAGVRRPFVVVAHAPHDLRADRVGVRLDEVAQCAVGIRLPEIGEVAGEHECLRRRVDPRQPVERRAETRDSVDRAVLPGVTGQEMRVAHVGDDVRGRGELAELDHEGERTAAPQPGRARRTARWGQRVLDPEPGGHHGQGSAELDDRRRAPPGGRDRAGRAGSPRRGRAARAALPDPPSAHQVREELPPGGGRAGRLAVVPRDGVRREPAQPRQGRDLRARPGPGQQAGRAGGRAGGGRAQGRAARRGAGLRGRSRSSPRRPRHQGRRPPRRLPSAARPRPRVARRRTRRAGRRALVGRRDETRVDRRSATLPNAPWPRAAAR